MAKALDIIADIIAIIWFIGVMLITLFFEMFMIFGVLFFDIIPMLKNGMPTTAIGFLVCFLVGIVYFVTGIIPVFRRCYYRFPWLYPLCMITTLHLYLLSIAELILAKGFSVLSTPRHVLTIVIMIVFVVAFRVVMCIYLKKRPLYLRKNENAD